ncbi:MAG: 50S ribosomal protein L21 [Acidobacteriota bacterium]
MFAIIKTGGKQYRVQEGDVLSVERLPAGEKKKVLFNQVLLIADDKQVVLGTPFIEQAAVRAEVVENYKHEKVIVFKKKRRKQYRRTRGHRQELTRVKILNIVSDVASLPAEEEAVEPEKPAAPAAVEVKEMKKPEAAAEKKPKKPEEKVKEKAVEAKPRKLARPKKQAPARKAQKKKSRK